MKRLLMLAAAVCLLLGASAPADAGMFGLTYHRHVGRLLGLGWSDGYHAPCCGAPNSWCGSGYCGSDCGGPKCFGENCFGPKVVAPSCCGGTRVVPTYGPK